MPGMTSAAAPPRLRIATFNLKDFFLPRSDAEREITEKKVASVARSLRRANADVVALQEVGEEAHLARLVEREVPELGYGPPLLGSVDRRGIRCALLTRLPVLWSQVHAPGTLTFPRFVVGDPEPFAGRLPLRRGVVHARLDTALGEVDVLTAHFKSNLGAPLRDATGAEVPDPSPRGQGEAALRSLVLRSAEALYVRGLVDDVLRTSPDHAICVLGDLNDRVDSMPVRILRGIGDPAHGAGLLHPCAERVTVERRFSCYHGDAPSLIDHVLVSSRLASRLQSFEIHNEELRSHGPHVEPIPLTEDSDHALSVGTFG